MARIVYIKNPLDPYRSQGILDIPETVTIEEAIKRVTGGIPYKNLKLCLSVNGMIEDDLSRFLTEEDIAVFCLSPLGSGSGTSKSVARVVAFVAIAAIAAGTGAWATGQLAAQGGIWGATGAASAWAVAAGAGAGALVGIGGALIVNALLPFKTAAATAGYEDSNTSSTTYSWTNTSNSTIEGGALPILYGTHRVVPPVINSYVTSDGDTQYLNVLYGVAGHSVSSITDIRINEQSVDYFSDIEVYRRLGEVNQAYIPGISDAVTDVGVGAKLSTTATTRVTDGNQVSYLGVGVYFPQGLYYVNDNGGYSAVEIGFTIKYRKAGTSDAYSYMVGGSADPANTYTKAKIIGGLSIDYTTTAVLGNTNVDISLSCPYTFVNANGTTRFTYLMYNVYTLVEGTTTWEQQVVRAKVNAGGTIIKSIKGIKGKKLTIRVERAEQGYYTDAPSCGVNTTAYQAFPDTTISWYTATTDIKVKVSSTSAFRRYYYVEGLSPSQYEIVVQLTSEPSTGTRWSTYTQWEYFCEAVTGDAFQYPGTALLAVKAPATDQLSGGQFKLDCVVTRGNLPSGYASTNPAWVCADILTNTRYGCGVAWSRLVSSKFTEWANYCSSQGYECNIYFDSFSTVQEALSTVSILGRGNIIPYAAGYTCTVDRPDTAVQHFVLGMGDITAGTYTEAYMSTSDRTNCIELTYYDRELEWEKQTVTLYQEDYDTTSTNPITTTITLLGCTARNQAIAYAKYLLRANKYLTITASFEANIDTIGCLPGDVIRVSHDVVGTGESGRITVVDSTTQIQLDREVNMVTGTKYYIRVQYSDDTSEMLQVVNTGITTNVIQVTTPFSKTPEVYNQYIFGTVNTQGRLMRLIGLTRTADNMRALTALEYNADVYNVDKDITVTTQSNLVPVKNLALKEVWTLASDGSGISTINASWRGNVLWWDVFYRKIGTNSWTRYGRTYTPNIVISGNFAYGETYEVSVCYGTVPSAGEIARITIECDKVPPDDVTNFIAWQDSKGVQFSWDHVPLVTGRGYQIRYGTTWASGTIIVNNIQENRASWEAPASGTYHFMIKAVNNSYIYSDNEASYSLTATTLASTNIVVEREQIPTYVSSATLYNLIYLSSSSVVAWIPGLTPSDISTLTPSDATISGYTGNQDNGYYISPVVNLGSSYTSYLRMQGKFNSDLYESLITPSDIGDRVPSLYASDTPTSITSASTITQSYQVNTTGTIGASWTNWVGTTSISGQYVWFKWSTNIDLPAQNYSMSSLYASLSVDVKEKYLYNQTISASGTTYTLSSIPFSYVLNYTVIPTVVSSTGYYATVVFTSTNFTVYVYNADGVKVSGTVNLAIRGV